MVKYRVFSGDNGYGIEAVEDGEAVNRVDSLFETEAEALEFAELCTVLDLSPIHLNDVSEDIIFLKNFS